MITADWRSDWYEDEARHQARQAFAITSLVSYIYIYVPRYPITELESRRYLAGSAGDAREGSVVRRVDSGRIGATIARGTLAG